MPITNSLDFDRNQLVNANDQIIARLNTGFLPRIDIPAPGALPAAAPSAVDAPSDAGTSAVAISLAAPPAAATPGQAVTWVQSRLESIDLNEGPIARWFTQLADSGMPRAQAVLKAADRFADALGLDDSLLDSLLDDFDLG